MPNTRPRSRHTGWACVYIQSPAGWSRSRELNSVMPRVSASVMPMAESATSSVP